MLFNRVVRVKITKSNQTEILVVENLKISFNVNKSAKRNTASISIYNMSETTRNEIDKLGNLIILEAGYVDSVGIIFVGNIRFIKKSRNKNDIITIIEAGDGDEALDGTNLSLSYGENIGVVSILEDIMKKMKIPKKISKIMKEKLKTLNNEYLSGFSFIGTAEEALEKVSKKLGLDWSIQNNAIKIVESGKLDESEQIVFLSVETGLVGVPERRDDITVDKSKNSKKRTGWDVRSLLISNIEPFSILSVNSKYITSKTNKFLVHSVQHSGDSHSGDFFTTATILEPL